MRANTVLLLSALMLISASGACSNTNPVSGQPTLPSPETASTTPHALGTVAAQTQTAQPPLTSPTALAITSTPVASIRRLGAGLPLTLSSVDFVSTTTGWGVGKSGADDNEHVLRTTDGGRTWTDLTPPAPLDPQGPLQATGFFRGDAMAWVAYAPGLPAGASVPQVIWRTEDGGQTWIASAPLDPPSQMEFFSIAQIAFLDDHTGWLWAVLGAGMNHTYIAIYGTQDGGQTWTRLLDPDTGGEMMICSKDGVGFVSQSTGWIAGDCHGVAQYLYLYQTVDGGRNWSLLTLKAPASAPSLFDPNLYYCGAAAPAFDSSTSGGLMVTCTDWSSSTRQSWLYITSDGGKTWTPRAAPAGGGVLQWLDAHDAWVLAGGALYRTTDGGLGWQTMAHVAWNGQPDFVDQKDGWIVARAEEAVALVHSTNGGKSWEEIKPLTR